MVKEIELNINEVKKFIKESSLHSKIYLGADSERFNKDGVWWVSYCIAVVIHIDSLHGAQVFSEITTERDYDKKLARPSTRLMTEVTKVAEVYMKLEEAIGERFVSVHLDINPLPEHGSSCVASSAVGYIRGVCGIDPVIKPNSWCATNVADRGKLLQNQFH